MFLSFASSSWSLSLTEIGNDFKAASNLLSNDVGKGDLISTDFGSVQLFCADSGTNNLTYARLALTAAIQPETTLKDPVLTLTDSKNVKDALFFYPVSRPLNSQKGLVYQVKATFPFWVELEQKGEPVSFTVLFSALWCQNDVCKPVSQKASFTVNSGKNYFSPYFGFISRAFNFVPSEAEKGQIMTQQLSDNAIWIKVKLKDEIKENPILLLLNNQNQVIQYTIKHNQIQKNQTIFVLSTNQKVESFRLLIQTDYAVFTQNVNLTPGPIPEKLFDDFPVRKLPIYLWFFFVCFSPTIVLLFDLKFKNEILVRSKVNYVIVQLILGILSAVLIYLVWPYAYLSKSYLWLGFCFILFAYLILSRRKIEPFVWGVLTSLLPYFAFFKGFGVPVPQAIEGLSLFFVKITLLNLVPFVLLLIKPIWAVKLTVASNQMPAYIKKYPLYMDLLLFAYLILMLWVRS